MLIYTRRLGTLVPCLVRKDVDCVCSNGPLCAGSYDCEDAAELVEDHGLSQFVMSAEQGTVERQGVKVQVRVRLRVRVRVKVRDRLAVG